MLEGWIKEVDQNERERENRDTKSIRVYVCIYIYNAYTSNESKIIKEKKENQEL